MLILLSQCLENEQTESQPESTKGIGSCILLSKTLRFRNYHTKPPTQIPTAPTTPRVSGTEFQRNTENSEHFQISTINIGPLPYASLSIMMTILLLFNPITPPIATLTQVIPVTIQSKIVGLIAFYLLIVAALIFHVLFSFCAVEPIVALKQCCIDNGFLFRAFDSPCILEQRKQIETANSGAIGLSFSTTMDILAIATRIVIALLLVILGIEPNLEIPGATLAIKNLFSFCVINPKHIALGSRRKSYNARQGRKVSSSKSGDIRDGEQGESVIVPQNQLAIGFEITLNNHYTYNTFITISVFVLVFFALLAFCFLSHIDFNCCTGNDTSK